MKIERDLHMIGGDGENSYALNSRVPRKAIWEAKPVLEKAISKVLHTTLFPQRMVIADLGCSSGPNTLLVVAEVIGAVGDCCQQAGRQPPELQLFLNDLPVNDFNLIFQSLEQLKHVVGKEKRSEAAAPQPPYYVVGLPGSLYGRLFPYHSVHLFHSNYCLMWRSQVPEELAESRRRAYQNEGNIYIGKTTPLPVVELFQQLFQRDFSLFLKLRFDELVAGGQMVLAFLGRKHPDVRSGELSQLWGLLAEALLSLVQKGLVEKEKVDSFNLPFYAPSMDEVKAAIEQSELFDITHLHLLESNWDPHDDSDSGLVADSAQSGANVAKLVRAVMAPLLQRHFAFEETVLDELFALYARNIAKHLEMEKTNFPIIILSLKTKMLKA